MVDCQTEWKSAKITHVHKKKSKELAENYRQISLLSVVSKTLERCVHNNFYHHVPGLISNEQHGFIRNHRVSHSSCPSSIPSWGNLDGNIETDILYLDFAKAFESVDHSILLAKVKLYEVTGKLHVSLLTIFTVASKELL